jgi:HK97 family phage major capsid protein
VAITTPTSAVAWAPDQIASFQLGAMVPDALIATTSTVVGVIQGDRPAMRVPYISADPPPAFYAEGAEITGGDPTLSELVFNTSKIAALARASNESLLQPWDTSAALFMSFQRSLRRQANEVYVSNPVTTGQPTGLLNAGIHDAGTLGSNLDGIVNAISFIESNYGSADHILVDPLSWGYLRSVKSTAAGGMPVLGPPSGDAALSLFGVPVIVTPAMPHTAPAGTTDGSGSILVIDRQAVMSAFADVQIYRSADVYFASDSTGLRATCRLGWGVLFPDRIAKLEVVLPH